MSPVNERQRMQYLEAMGVETFVPRWVLPGARVSLQCRLPVSADADTRTPAASASQSAIAVSEKQSKPARALVDSLLERVSPTSAEMPDKPSSSPNRAAPVLPGATQAEATQTEVAAFSLAFWRVHPQVMVVDSRQPQVLPTEALLRALLSGLGLTGALPRAEMQVWPMPGSSDKSWSAACEMMHAFLEGRLLSQPVSFLVVMGGDAAKAILGDAADQVVDGRVSLDNFACDALVTPSLAELLLQPHLKARLWSLLKPLRQLTDDSN